MVTSFSDALDVRCPRSCFHPRLVPLPVSVLEPPCNESKLILLSPMPSCKAWYPFKKSVFGFAGRSVEKLPIYKNRNANKLTFLSRQDEFLLFKFMQAGFISTQKESWTSFVENLSFGFNQTKKNLANDQLKTAFCWHWEQKMAMNLPKNPPKGHCTFQHIPLFLSLCPDDLCPSWFLYCHYTQIWLQILTIAIDHLVLSTNARNHF